MSVHPIILCGGAGTRLWPLSRKDFPKQFLAIAGEKTLFEQVVTRLSGPDFAPPLIVTGDDFRFIVESQLGADGARPDTILIEPAAKGTAAAVIAAAAHLQARHGPCLALVAPSDHLIPDVALFRSAVAKGVAAARDGAIVTFGIVPNYPETGFGYIEVGKGQDTREGAVSVSRFVEKPDLEKAKAMLQAGNFYWNAGIFLFDTDQLLRSARALAPEVTAAAETAVVNQYSDFGFVRLEENAWAKSPSISFDHAIMEYAERVMVVPYEGKWSDLGGWDAVLQETRAGANTLASSGNVTAINCENSLLRSEDERIELVGVGLKDIIAVAMQDAVLVADRRSAQDVKLAVDVLRQKGRRQADFNPRIYRPWGTVETLFSSSHMHIRHVKMRAGTQLTLQTHLHRSEHWIVLKGDAEIEVDGYEFQLHAGESVGIPSGARHRLRNGAAANLEFIEVQVGDLISEDDIERFNDAGEHV